MKFVPSNPVVFVLVIIAFFATGMLFGKMFGKKKAEKKAEKFDSEYQGEFDTPQRMASGPKVLPPVPENKGVVSGDTWCKKFNC